MKILFNINEEDITELTFFEIKTNIIIIITIIIIIIIIIIKIIITGCLI